MVVFQCLIITIYRKYYILVSIINIFSTFHLGIYLCYFLVIRRSNLFFEKFNFNCVYNEIYKKESRSAIVTGTRNRLIEFSQTIFSLS